MPQALIALTAYVVSGTLLGGGILSAIATVVLTAGLSALFLGGGGRANTEAAERSIKSPTPPRVRCRGRRRLFGSQMLFDTASNGTTVDVWAFNDGPGNVTGHYLNDEPVTVVGNVVQPGEDGRYGDLSPPKVRVGTSSGAPTETAFAAIVSLVPDIWTTNHRGDGIVAGWMTKAPVKSEDFLTVYPQGDNVALSLVGEWGKCFDPRNPAHDPLDRSTWTYAENAALHLLDHYLSDRGYDYAAKIAPVVQFWIDAANICDEPVPLAAGGTEPRYRACVAYDFTKAPADVVSELLSCFDGWTGQDENGCQIVYAGKVYAPTVTIGPDQIVGYSHQEFVEDEDRINELVLQYVSDQHDFNTVEGQAWRDEDDISARGKINSDGLSLQAPSFPQVRRLAKRSMARRCAAHRGTVITTIEGKAILGKRYINLHLEEAGAVFYSGIAEIIGAERDYDTGGLSFTWLSIDPNVDAWNPATEEGEPAPVGSRVAQQPLAAPIINSAEPQFESEDTVARALLDIEGPDRTDLTWFARWRLDGDVSWNEAGYADLDPGTPVSVLTGMLPLNADVEIQAAYGVGDGRKSPWSATVEVDTTP